MEVELRLENVGGFAGTVPPLKLKRGVNVIKAPSAIGKSSVMKGIAALLSLPYYDDVEEEVARRLGILGGPDEPNPLVNVGAEKAVVELKSNEKVMKVVINGGIRVEPPGRGSFLLTSVLSPETQLMRKIMDGDDDISWIVDRLSLSKRYSEAKRILEEFLAEAQLMLHDVEQKRAISSKAKGELKDLKKRKELIEKEIEEIERKASSLPAVSSELQAERDTLRQDYDSIKRRLVELESEKRELEAELKPKEREKRELTRRLNELRRMLKEVSKELEELQRGKRRDQLTRMIKAIEKEIENLGRSVYEKEGVLKLYESAISLVKEKGKAPCPLCNVGTLTSRVLEEKRNVIESELRDIKNSKAGKVAEKSKLYGELSTIDDKFKDLKSHESELKERIKGPENRLIGLSRDIEAISNKYQNLLQETDKLKLAEDDFLRKLKNVERRISEIDEPRRKLYEALGRRREELKGMDGEVRRLSEEIEFAAIMGIRGIYVSMDDAFDITDKWLNILRTEINHLDNRIEEQRVGAVRKFNERIGVLLRGLRLSEFDEVWIDETNLRLVVTRRGGKRRQPVRSLSTSERYALSTVLQLTVKEVYAPEEDPYLLIDGTLPTFDEETGRKSALLNYIAKIANERQWIVVISDIGGKELAVEHFKGP